MLEKYVTIKGTGQAEVVEKKSRFIANVVPVHSEEEAMAEIEKFRKKYYDARHNVFAFQVGNEKQLQRYSDDGEPSGTAGMPVLDVIRGRDIHDVLIVVTRYFGGTLLGTGGLVRAYGQSAKEGLAAAGLIERTLYKAVHVKTDYNMSGKVQYEALNTGNIIKDTIDTDNVEFIILVESNNVEGFVKSIVNLTSDKAEIVVGEEEYLDKVIE